MLHHIKVRRDILLWMTRNSPSSSFIWHNRPKYYIRNASFWRCCSWYIFEMVHDSCHIFPCWRHQMEIFSALLAICAGNSPVSGEFPAQRPATQSFDVFFDPCLNKRLSEQSWGWWFETLYRPLWRRCNAQRNIEVQVKGWFPKRKRWPPQGSCIGLMLLYLHCRPVPDHRKAPIGSPMLCRWPPIYLSLSQIFP